MRVSELARAKVNLTLRVLGKRPDGFHELDSVVAFAGVGDLLTLEPADRFELIAPGVDVPAAANLVGKAAAAFAARFGPQPYRLTLAKRLPIAAGLGGGSADAAAALRLLAARLPAPPDVAAEITRATALLEIAEPIGSDVTVCLANVLTHMRGRGHELTALPAIRALPAVLVNAGAAVPANKTAQVFARLAAGPVGDPLPPCSVDAGAANGAAALQRVIETVGNDLEPAARQVMPEIGDVLAVLSACDGVLVARMSGAGPTCFGLFGSTAEAEAAAAAITVRRPAWWVVATTLN